MIDAVYNTKGETFLMLAAILIRLISRAYCWNKTYTYIFRYKYDSSFFNTNQYVKSQLVSYQDLKIISDGAYRLPLLITAVYALND